MKIETFTRMTLFGRRYFFRIKASNGETVAQSEAYNTKQARDHTVQRIIHNVHPSMPIVDENE